MKNVFLMCRYLLSKRDSASSEESRQAGRQAGRHRVSDAAPCTAMACLVRQCNTHIQLAQHILPITFIHIII